MVELGVLICLFVISVNAAITVETVSAGQRVTSVLPPTSFEKAGDRQYYQLFVPANAITLTVNVVQLSCLELETKDMDCSKSFADGTSEFVACSSYNLTVFADRTAHVPGQFCNRLRKPNPLS